MLGDDAAKIHPIKLIAAQNQHVFKIVVEKMEQVFPHGVGCALVPRGVAQRLFRSEDFHKTAREMIEFVGLRDMPMQRRRIEMREQINAAQIGVDAIGDRDIHEPVFTGQGDGRLGALLGEWEQAAALPSSHDDREHIARGGRHSFALHIR